MKYKFNVNFSEQLAIDRFTISFLRNAAFSTTYLHFSVIIVALEVSFDFKGPPWPKMHTVYRFLIL